MNINHHNYEEYFILYMDNELGSDARRMVEAFVQQHPELKGELDLLLQYKLVPDTDIVFDGKEELMKTGDNSVITLSNYDEWFILYMDNELTTGQKTAVEQFMSANPSLKKEFGLLQCTKLQPEVIIFADKASLYRTEEKVKPMPVRWWRVAAAAVLLLGIGITTAVVLNKKSLNKEIVKVTIPETKKTTETPVVVPNKSVSPDNESIAANNNTQVLTPVVKQNNNNNSIAKEKNMVLKNHSPVIITPQPIKEESVVANNDKKSNDLPKPLNNPNINNNDAANNAVATNTTSKENKQQVPLTNSVVTTQNPQSSDIVNASYTELDQPDGKKNKNRGFFRKIARTFEKRTDIDPTDDNKLLIAGISIKLK